MKHILLSLFAAVLLSACGTSQKISTDELSKPIPEKQARVIVERSHSLLYMAASSTVMLNGQKIAGLAPGGSVLKNTFTGNNVLTVSTPTASGRYTLKFDAKAGETYKFIVSPRGGNIMGGYGLGILGDAIQAEVSEQSGYFKIEPIEAE